jgi:hypothetical protein
LFPCRALGADKTQRAKDDQRGFVVSVGPAPPVHAEARADARSARPLCRERRRLYLAHDEDADVAYRRAPMLRELAHTFGLYGGEPRPRRRRDGKH